MTERWIDQTVTNRELEQQLHAYAAANRGPDDSEEEQPQTPFEAFLAGLLDRHVVGETPVTPFDR